MPLAIKIIPPSKAVDVIKRLIKARVCIDALRWLLDTFSYLSLALPVTDEVHVSLVGGQLFLAEVKVLRINVVCKRVL